jgi:hypothetical protein
MFFFMKSYMIIESISSVAAGIACFRLASHREDIANQKHLSRMNTQPVTAPDAKKRRTGSEVP